MSPFFTPLKKVIARLEEILCKECKLPVKLALREVEQKVIVAHGKYHSQPLAGRDKDEIDLYGKQLVPNSRAGGGGGDFERFLKAAGVFIGRRIVSEVEDAPRSDVSWRYHKRSPFTEEERKEDTDQELVLKHIGEQTGLTFKEETRKVWVLLVERKAEGK